jgi:hydroxypyruvate isomerase
VPVLYNPPMLRRDFVTGLAAASAVVSRVSAQTPAVVPRKGRLKQCITRGVFDSSMPFEDMCREAARLGCKGFDLVPAQNWPILKKYGLIPTMRLPNMGVTIPDGINRKDVQDDLVKSMRPAIDECAANGCPNLITVSGSRRGMSDAEGADNSVAFLNQVKAQAEDKGVTICLELLNSKIDHKDQMCDHTAWGVEVCRRVNSPRVKLLVDIYHMQIMEGDVIRTIRNNIDFIGHFHTGGVPGRHEINGSQELNYHAIAVAIADLNYRGYVAHEFVPTRSEPFESLTEAFQLCTV